MLNLSQFSEMVSINVEPLITIFRRCGILYPSTELETVAFEIPRGTIRPQVAQTPLGTVNMT